MPANWDQEVSGVMNHELNTKLVLKCISVVTVGIIVVVACVVLCVW